MIVKCANPACSVPFHYLRDGKIFRLEFGVDRRLPGPVLAGRLKPVRRVEHFWLCGRCSATHSVVMHEGRATTVPLNTSAFKAAAAS